MPHKESRTKRGEHKKAINHDCELKVAKQDLNLCQEERDEYKRKHAQATEIGK